MGMMYMAFALGYRETAQDWPLKATHSLELAAATDGSDNDAVSVAAAATAAAVTSLFVLGKQSWFTAFALCSCLTLTIFLFINFINGWRSII